MKAACALLFLLIAAPLRAQDRSATSIFLGGAVFDDVTTWRNMQAGHTENNPLYASMRDKPKAVALSLIVTDVLTLWLAHRYTPTHPKLVKVVLLTFGGIRLTEGVTNARAWYLDTHRPFDLSAH